MSAINMLRLFITSFEHNLDVRLQEKTSWGRNDLKLLIKTVLADTLLEIMK
jgi:hypothetical protein